MKCIDPGHSYLLDDMEGGSTQQLNFIKKVKIEDRFETVSNGTTNEEVLAVLIDRIHALDAKLACWENTVVLTHLETAQLWLEKRTRARKAMGVEGTPLSRKNKDEK